MSAHLAQGDVFGEYKLRALRDESAAGPDIGAAVAIVGIDEARAAKGSPARAAPAARPSAPRPA